METEKLYYKDSHMTKFTAKVLACEPAKNGYEIILDRTAFFPEGGGQGGDVGTLGGVNVTDTREKGALVAHFTDSPLEVGKTVEGEINWPVRFQRTQNHSGEHIVSGLIHSLFGYDNVGFHMNEEEATLDCGGELTMEDVRKVERLANEAVWKNVPIVTTFPDPETLKTLNYRSKLDLTENVRIVEVVGYDLCACCAPHVSLTGEIGQIRLLTAARHRGGMRMTMVCGGRALTHSIEKSASAASISASLSVKQADIADAVEKLKTELADAKYQLSRLRRDAALEKLAGQKPTEGNICLFTDGLSADDLRALVNKALPMCGKIAAGFNKTETGWQYIIASQTVNLKAAAKDINQAIKGKGGGSETMIQGSAAAEKEAIESYFR